MPMVKNTLSKGEKRMKLQVLLVIMNISLLNGMMTQLRVENELPLVSINNNKAECKLNILTSNLIELVNKNQKSAYFFLPGKEKKISLSALNHETGRFALKLVNAWLIYDVVISDPIAFITGNLSLEDIKAILSLPEDKFKRNYYTRTIVID